VAERILTDSILNKKTVLPSTVIYCDVILFRTVAIVPKAIRSHERERNNDWNTQPGWIQQSRQRYRPTDNSLSTEVHHWYVG